MPPTSYLCKSCGNKTRFDVFETRRSRRFHHYSLGGELNIEEEETLELDVEKVVCRWCGSADHITETEGDPEGSEVQPADPSEVAK